MTALLNPSARARRRNRRPAWEEPPTVAGQLVKGAVLTGVVLAVLIPVWSILVTSFSSRQAIADAGGMVFRPRDFDLSAYVLIFTRGEVSRAVWNSMFVTVTGTLLALVCTVLAAYGLSRPGSLFHRPLLLFFLITFLIGPGLIPSYVVVTSLGLKDSHWSLILPAAVNAFNLIVVRQFFMGIPGELIDSARIDGAGEWRILTRIVLPLSKAVVAVVGLFYAVGYWNMYFNAVLYLNNSEDHVVQQVLQAYILAGQSPAGIGSPPALGFNAPPSLAVKMAVVVVVLIPIVIVYPFIQRHFTKGVITGALKG
ncbi:carbohydrate ABC transporter permease [Catellatospora bangladeshensis]|uniref:ABC transporter permease n=1 Tax=Catellatospora bangladeshensis TaxID=310355 RepID=A0A8J3JC22_9ACTN|nr:carbohydrate ABC transporter permease [Catellatospora bangladeshensis]GIF79874.1 ABC transporter permease [Catellatospora bangladeshensis]